MVFIPLQQGNIMLLDVQVSCWNMYNDKIISWAYMKNTRACMKKSDIIIGCYQECICRKQPKRPLANTNGASARSRTATDTTQNTQVAGKTSRGKFF